MGRDGDGHYEVLGVEPDASMAEIRRSYLRLARDAHPDFHNGSEPERRRAETRMRRINEAWAVLGDVDERSTYDRMRISGQPRRPFHSGRHGQVDEPDLWQPFDDGPATGFDERDDRPITDSALPSWLKTGPALGVLFGFAAVLVGSLVGLVGIFQAGVIVMIISACAFVLAPLVALSLSRSQDRQA